MRNRWLVLNQQLPCLVSVSGFNDRVLVRGDGGIHQQSHAAVVVRDENSCFACDTSTDAPCGPDSRPGAAHLGTAA